MAGDPVGHFLASVSRLMDEGTADPDIERAATAAFGAVTDVTPGEGDWSRVLAAAQLLYLSRARSKGEEGFSEELKHSVDGLIFALVTVLCCFGGSDVPEPLLQWLCIAHDWSGSGDELWMVALRLVGRLQEEQRSDALAVAILALQVLNDLTNDPGPRTLTRRGLVHCRTGLYILSRDFASLERALGDLRADIESTDDDEERLTLLDQLTLPLWLRVMATGELSDVNDLITALQCLQTARGLDRPERRQLADALLQRVQAAGDPAGLDEAIALFRELAEEETGFEEIQELVFSLGRALIARFTHLGDREALDQAADLQYRAFNRIGLPSADLQHLNELVDTLHLSAVHLENSVALAEEIRLRRAIQDLDLSDELLGIGAVRLAQAIAITPEAPHAAQEAALWCASGLLRLSADHSERREAAQLLRTLLAAVDAESASESGLWQQLTSRLRVRWSRLRPTARLGQAQHMPIPALWARLASTEGSGSMCRVLVELANAYDVLYTEAREVWQLQLAITARRVVLPHLPEGRSVPRCCADIV